MKKIHLKVHTNNIRWFCIMLIKIFSFLSYVFFPQYYLIEKGPFE